MTEISRVLTRTKYVRKIVASCLIVAILSLSSAFLIGCAGNNSTGDGFFGRGNAPEVWVAAAKDDTLERWGLIDESGEWVLEPQFMDVTYSNLSGCIWAESLPTDTNTNGGWGLFDVVSNEWAIEPQFNEIRDFDASRLAAAQTYSDDLWGFIDETGAWVIEPRFVNVGRFASNGLAVAEQWTSSLYAEGGAGFIDTSGSWVIEPKYEINYSSDHWEDGFAENGLALVIDPNSNGAVYIDEAGAWVLGPFEFYSEFGRFASNGLAAAFDGEGFLNSGGFLDGGQALFGFIDATGKWAIEPQFAGVRDFSDGLAYVTKVVEGGWGENGFIDETGAWVIGPFNSYVLDFQQVFDSNGLAVARDAVPESQSVLYGYLNKAGEWAIEPQFSSAGRFSENGLAPVMVRDLTKDPIAPGSYWGHWGFIDETGNWVIEPQFKVARSFELL